MERQLTHAPHGHVLTNANVWSPDIQWIVYDVRSDPAGSQFDGNRIERVNVKTGEVQTLYQSRRGAQCGVATCCPIDDRVAFILGPEDPTPDWQYCAYHRRGVIVDAKRPGVIENLDARDVAPPFTPGALRGGSHVHLFSGDGQWVSFTYEDHVLATGAGAGDADLNQRNVAVAAAYAAVNPPLTHPRNHAGQFFSVLATKTVNEPRPGTDDIQRAYEEAWVGAHGYRRADGRWQWPALAFLGDLLDADGKPFTELFIVDLPEDVTRPGDGPLEGTTTRRPAPPAGAQQRRLTFTADRTHPGVQGPRHWPRSSPDGSQIAFLMRDDAGVVQLWTVSPSGGSPRQITADPWSVESAFTWSPRGTRIAYIGDGSVMTVDVASGKSTRITPPSASSDRLRPEACVYSPDGRHIAFCREIEGPEGRFNQICIVETP
jgi:hypothetical protein